MQMLLAFSYFLLAATSDRNFLAACNHNGTSPDVALT